MGHTNTKNDPTDRGQLLVRRRLVCEFLAGLLLRDASLQEGKRMTKSERRGLCH